ncbi:MAG: hypothetical protein V3W04_00800 [Gammaproteobacteria bacterium]
MSTIRVPAKAYILSLLPQSADVGPGHSRFQPRGRRLQALANGLAVPSFWTPNEINRAFSDANDIWKREADIEFTPILISIRSEQVPADEGRMWPYFLNHLSPRTRGVSVSFVYDLPSHEGGWGGGRIAVVSGQRIGSGLAGFAGSLLAHELGHVMLNSPNHSNDVSNLMYGNRNPRMANAGLLNSTQVRSARSRALSI